MTTFPGGTRKGLTYGPITSSVDDKKAKRRVYNTSMTASDLSKLRCNTIEREDESGEFTLLTSMYISLH